MFINAAHHLKWDLSTPQVMGILNATPDSFYAQSRVKLEYGILQKVTQFIHEGVQVIDVGGQSTRPGANRVDIATEIARVVPVIEMIHHHYPNQLISIDTYQSDVAKAALIAGAHIVNDISAGSFDPAILKVVSHYEAGYIGMHLTGSVENLHEIEKRTAILPDLISYFKTKKQEFKKKGLNQWVIDPGFGFGKTLQENFELVQKLDQLKELELPILLGVSRKSAIYKTLGVTPEEALNGTTVLNTVGLLKGASILRVHDVKEAVELIKLIPFLK